jgi:hypothetical protein
MKILYYTSIILLIIGFSLLINYFILINYDLNSKNNTNNINNINNKENVYDYMVSQHYNKMFDDPTIWIGYVGFDPNEPQQKVYIKNN